MAASGISLRERNRMRTRQTFLDAALDEFAESGFGSATVEAIASRAGASKATLYAYFPQGRDELFREIYENINAELLEQAQAVYEQRDGSHIDRIMALTRALMEVARNPRTGRFYSIEDPALDVTLDPVRGHASRVWTDLIADDLAQAAEAGMITSRGSAHATAVLLVGAMRSALSDVSLQRAGSEEILDAYESIVRSL